MVYIICAMALAAAFPLFFRSVHMFQLCSYQFLSYRKYLKDHVGETFSPVRILIAAAGTAACINGNVSGAALSIVAAGCSFIFCFEKNAKKPLVFTKRVVRLTVCHAIICTGLMTAGFFTVPYVFWPATVLGQPFILMLSAAICAPLEKRISKRYIDDAARILRESPDLKVIGITGSFGKTSTKEFLYNLLSAKTEVCATPGNFNTTLGVTRTVREKLSPLHRVFICEMGARHVGDIKEICDLVHPQIGIVTAVAPQHLETFGSMDAILHTKLELYDAVKDVGVAFVCRDSEPLGEWGEHKNVIFYGTSGSGYVASEISADLSGLHFRVTAPNGDSCRFDTRLLGKANVLNITAAIAVCHYLGMDMNSMVPRVRAFPQVAHRLQLIPGSGMTIIDDAYNANPKGCEMALDTLELFSGARIVVTPGMVELGEKEEELNTEMGAYAASKCDYAVLVDLKRAVPIRNGLISNGFPEDRIFPVSTLGEAMEKVRQIAGEKTVLLLNDLSDQY